MSFADQVREELCELPIKNACCRRALCEGLLLCANAKPAKLVTVRYKQEMVATLASAQIHLNYAKAPDSEMSGASGHRYYDLSFTSPAAHRCVAALAQGVLPAFACEGCKNAFLRGAFLATGSINDPQKSFHLEFSLPNEPIADALTSHLQSLGYPPRRVRRGDKLGLYYKDSGSVEELVALMGAQHTIFDIINNRIEREIRNNENRATNCVAKNIEKTIAAATAQMEAIGALMEHGRLEGLEESLQESARLRYENPDATLDELAAMHTHPITKSGLNHRLSKLLELAEKYSEKRG